MTNSKLDTMSMGPDFTITRMGYGAMQLAGPGVFGPPKDRAAAVAVLRAAIDAGITHIDTSDFYGPYVTNQIIKEALHPYADDLTIVTKVGATRGEDASWNHDLSQHGLIAAVHSNLKNLDVESLDVVNLRVGDVSAPRQASIAEPFSVLVDLQKQGLIRHLGVSNVTDAQLTEAQAVAPVVTVQNHYNVANRRDDALVDRCANEQIVFAPYFPLGGFTPLQSDTLDKVAADAGASTQQVALAWLLQRSPAIAVIPGTSSPEHLRENIAAADIDLSSDLIDRLDSISA